jgi:sugar phosphate isomerase/epimerase
MTKTGVALFSMRELDEPIAEMLRYIVDAGYEGVEFVNRMHPEIDVDSVATALADTGLETAGVHVWLHELEDNLPELADTYGALGCDTFVIPYHPDSALRTETRLQDLVDRLNALATRVDEYGCNLLYHPNHWDMIPFFDGPIFGRLPSLRPTDYLFERTDPVRTADEESFTNGLVDLFRRGEIVLTDWRDTKLDGWFIRSGAVTNNSVRNLSDTPLGYILDRTDPDTFGLQVDVSFFAQQGYDPVAVTAGLSDRISSMHLKDLQLHEYTVGSWPSFVDPGQGIIDFKAVAETAQENNIDWILVENGHSTDPVTTIERGVDELDGAIEPDTSMVSDD